MTRGCERDRAMIGFAAVLSAVVVALAGPALALAAATKFPTRQPQALAPDDPAARDIARTIESRLSARSPAVSVCDRPIINSLRDTIEAVIASAVPNAEVAGRAIDIVRREAAPADTCQLAALEESATEISGKGETVDEGESVRGFELYTGPMPPPARPALETVATVPRPVTDAGPTAPPKPDSQRHHHHSRATRPLPLAATAS